MHISHFRFMICDSLFLQGVVVKNEYSFAQVCKMSQMLGCVRNPHSCDINGSF